MDFNTALAIDYAEKESGGKQTERTAFPDYPDQNASKLAFSQWYAKTRDDLIKAGFGCMIRNETPRDCLDLVDRQLLPVPTDAAAAVTVGMKNADITHQNTVNASKRRTIVNEYKTRMAAQLLQTMRKNAG